MVTKPAMKVELTGLDVLPVKQYVGVLLKLLRAIDYFNIDCVGKVAMDIGASQEDLLKCSSNAAWLSICNRCRL